MSLSVLSAALVILASSGNGGAQMSMKDSNAYRLVVPSIASIVRGRESIGTAALVDSSGLFLAHTDCVYGKRVSARLSDGRLVSMTLMESDDSTQLAILQADDWIKSARPLRPAADLKSGDSLMAVLPSGLIRAEYVGGKSGLVAQSRRLMLLSEISFEAPAERIGGGLVMTPNGNLVGFLNAALHSSPDEANIQSQPSQLAQGDEGPAPASASLERGFLPKTKNLRVMQKPGPADMTVAYTPGLRVFRRTLESLIHGKDVERPSIGVDVKKNPSGADGALIERVEPGSAADQAGLKVGDIVIEIDGKDIETQMDLAKAVMDEEVGATMRVKVRRGQTMLTVPVVVGSRPGKNRTTAGSST